MAKRGGHSYDPTGIGGMSPGELAVRCPACPIPSINLPPNWQSVQKDSEYVNSLYSQLLSLTPLIPGISTIKCLALMHASDSRENRSWTMRRIWSLVLGMLTPLRGIHTVNIFIVLLIKMRFVLFVLY